MMILAALLFGLGILLMGADTVNPRDPYTWQIAVLNVSGLIMFFISLVLAHGQRKSR